MKMLEEWASEVAYHIPRVAHEEGPNDGQDTMTVAAAMDCLRRLVREVGEELIDAAEDGTDQDHLKSPYGIGCNCASYARQRLEEICGGKP